MSDQHERFLTWIRGPRDAPPPRDAAFHAAFCSDCRRSIAAFDALAAVDLGAAPLPPLGSATRGARVLMPLEPSVRWMLGLLAVATLALVAAIVIPGALRQAGGSLTGGGPNPDTEGAVLGQLGTPRPSPTGDASGEPSTIRIGQKIPSTLDGAIVVPAGPSPTDGPPVPFGPTDAPFSAFPFPTFPFPPFTFAPGPTPTGNPTFSASASASASPSAPPSPTGTATSTGAPTGTPTAEPTATSVPTATAPPTVTPAPTLAPTPTPVPTISPFDSASCFDGVDNDGDGATDGADLGCVVRELLPLGEGYLLLGR